MDARFEKEEGDKISTDGQYHIRYRRNNGRKNSQVILTNRETNETAQLDTVTKLGEGTYGTVREFRKNKHAIAVKDLRDRELYFKTEGDRREGIKNLQLEQNFLMRCYPHDTPYALFIWREDGAKKFSHYPYKIDCRIIMPVIQGATLKTWIRANTDKDMLALVIFNMAKELQRFHDLGILHGDVSPRNIMILPDFSTHFIDFSFAYDITESATTFEVPKPDNHYIAPERLNVKPHSSVKANFAQDVYSLAHTIHLLVERYFSLPATLAFYQKYPAIERFITNGRNKNPGERPTLQSLIKDLSPSLMMPSLKSAVAALEGDYLISFLKKKIDSCYTTDMNELLHTLCLQKTTDKAELVIKFLRDEVPAYQHNRLLDIFTTIVELRKDMKQPRQGKLFDDCRKILIEQLATAIKFAETLIHHPGTPLAPELLQAIHHAPKLFDIHNALFGDQPMTMSISSSDSLSM